MKWTSLKIFSAFGCGALLFIAISAIVTFSGIFNGDTQPVTNRLTEAEKISELPLIKGVVVADSTVMAPFAKKPVALSFFKTGYEQAEYPKRIPGSKKSGYPSGYHWVYTDASSVITNANAKIKLGDVLYDVDFNEAIVEADSSNYQGVFRTNPYDKGLHGYEVKVAPQLRYLEKFKDKNKLIDVYVGKRIYRSFKYKDYGYPANIIVRDIVYRNGDSIYIRGKIENGKIIPLF